MSGLAVRTPIRIVFVASLMTALIGCSRAKPIGLSNEGYNYTNRFIVDLTVTDESGNSAWGGDVLLSTTTAGGGKEAGGVSRHPKN